jgi:arsenite-transporting ATPase
MPQILIFSGSAGPGIATAAAGLALGIAAQGQRTLLLSLGSAAGLGALLDVQLSAQVTSVAPDLDVLVPDPAAELTELWERMSGQMPDTIKRLSADELPLLPGAGALFGLARLAELRSDYSRIIVDAGSHDTLLTTLGLPDISRWLLRLLVGLDRGPGHSRSSVASALLPAGLLPSAALENVQELRMRMEQVRAELIDPQIACA